MAGVWMFRDSISPYLEFPPETVYIHPAPFSWIAFFGYAAFIVPVTAFLLYPLFKPQKNLMPGRAPGPGFPWWGWAGAGLGLVAWLFAWTRFDWFSMFQAHTFTPLWMAYILVVNGLKHARTGRSMLTHKPLFFCLLFPASAAFWWFFEYLNRFVQNWHYQGGEFTSWEYFLYASLSFSTVLPAVLGTQDLLQSGSGMKRAYGRFMVLDGSRHARLLACLLLAFAGSGLLLIGVFPDYLFALLWISPLLILVSLQVLMKEGHIFSGMARGDWGLVISYAFAALICGVFWEMWNYWSLARWTYAVPFVHRFEIFEMPLLGYAGYLPFGLECGVVGMILEDISK